ncbi:MAG: hypothetical protein WCT10_02940 [Patescibacteria group bacterium]|jgi:hypothetical protein
MAAGVLLLIAVAAVGLLIIKLDEKQARRQQLRLGLTDWEVDHCRKFGISLEEMAARKQAAAETLRQFCEIAACLPRQSDLQSKADPIVAADPSDPLVLKNDGPSGNRRYSNGSGGQSG